jgi:hypothetical protein
MGAFDLALRLTLLDLLLRPIGAWSLRPWILALAAAGLLFPVWHRQRALWLALIFLTALRVSMSWPLADNDAYLLSYWCLGILIALRAPGPASPTPAGGLVGLVFLLAVVWKGLLSPDYLDGTFFRVTLVVDERFEGLSRLVGDMPAEVLEHNREILGQHVDGPVQAGAAPPILGARFDAFAWFATGWTLAIEAFVAIGFLLGARWRHAALMVFCATVYSAAPVAGFGWLLVAMGVAQCSTDEARTRWLYASVYALILVYREIPWALLLAERLPATVPG